MSEVMSVKKLLKSDGVRRVLCWLGSLYIRLVHLLSRWRTVRAEIPEAYWRDGTPFILCFWHGRLLMLPYCWNHRHPIHMLISQHRDGQIIARTIAHFGVHTIAGSSSRGGAQALRAMVKSLKAGECIGITPDGPRGPRMRASEGVVSVARLAGVPIIPVAFSTSRGRLLRSWDRFMVAWPFGRSVVVWGDPIEVPRNADATELERLRSHVEVSLNAITEEADHLVGRTPVEPAPVADDNLGENSA